MFKFGLKACVAAGAAYYLADQGVWKDSHESTKLYGKMYSAVQPYLKEVKTQLPVEVPELPRTENISILAKQYWNKGVSTTFVFLGNLQQHLNHWTSKGFDIAKENPEIKKFIESFSSQVESVVDQKK